MPRFLMVLIVFWLIGVQVAAAQPTVPEDTVLTIGTKHAPPFVIKNEDGTWSGISIDLWRDIASQLSLDYQIVETDLQSLVAGVQEGGIDASVAALTITEAREEVLDFTHPFYTSGLSIAVRTSKESGAWSRVLSRFFSWKFFQIISALVGILLFVGALAWLCEHSRNRENRRSIKSIGEGFWWAAVTMTTVGYGDKTPLTLMGRFLGIVWMFTAIMLVASFIAAFTTALTVDKLESTIISPDDLSSVNVATVPASTSQAYLNRYAIASKNYATPIAGMEAVVAGEMDVVVYDAPILKYLARKEFSGQLEVQPIVFERQDYGIALPTGSPMREQINRVMLRIITQPAWQSTLQRYFGK